MPTSAKKDKLLLNYIVLTSTLIFMFSVHGSSDTVGFAIKSVHVRIYVTRTFTVYLYMYVVRVHISTCMRVYELYPYYTLVYTRIHRHHSLRKRVHGFELKEKGGSLTQRNFNDRMLCKNIYWQYIIYCTTYNKLSFIYLKMPYILSETLNHNSYHH